MIDMKALCREIDKILECPMSWCNIERLSLLLTARHRLEEYKEQDEDHHEGHRKLDEHTAKKWAESMRHTADGGVGPHWTMEQTTQLLQQRGWPFDRAEFYAVMNAVWSDYGKTAQKYGVDKTDFWADLAHDWLADDDAKSNKAAIYYAEIASK